MPAPLAARVVGTRRAQTGLRARSSQATQELRNYLQPSRKNLMQGRSKLTITQKLSAKAL